MRIPGGLALKIAVAAASFAIAGIGIEVALRWLGEGPMSVNPDQRSFWSYHSALGWIGSAGREGTLDNGSFRFHVAINSRGLRGDETTLRKPEGVRRVLVIGDSFAWGFGVEQEEIFGARLEAALSKTEVINAGVSGYSTDQSLLWLREEGMQYDPDVVVYVLSGNDDIMNHMQVAYWIYYKPSFRLDRQGNLVLQGVPVPRASFGDRLRHALRSRSALAKAIEFAIVGQEAPFVYLANAFPDPADPHRLTAALVDAMRDAAESVGASFVVVSDSRFWFSPLGSYPELVGKLRATGHQVIDVETWPAWDDDAMRIPGDGHWNDGGHHFVAQLLVERLGGTEPRLGE